MEDNKDDDTGVLPVSLCTVDNNEKSDNTNN